MADIPINRRHSSRGGLTAVAVQTLRTKETVITKIIKIKGYFYGPYFATTYL